MGLGYQSTYDMIKVEEGDRLLRNERARMVTSRRQQGWHLTTPPTQAHVRVALVAALLAVMALVGAGAAAQPPSEDPGCVVVSGGKLAC